MRRNDWPFVNALGRCILAGICIGVGSYVNMKLGGVAGAVMFAFGLLVIVKMGYGLFTGLAGRVPGRITLLLLSLIGNFIGCAAMGLLGKYCSVFDMSSAADAIMSSRIAAGPLKCFFLSIPCGAIVTWAVVNAREDGSTTNWMPLFLGVPIFILCGFPHCIADIYTMSAVSDGFLFDNWQSMLAVWGSIILGNYIGCNIFRIEINSESRFF